MVVSEQRREIAVEFVQKLVDIEQIIGGYGIGSGRVLGGQRPTTGILRCEIVAFDDRRDKALRMAAFADDSDHPEMLTMADDSEVLQVIAPAAGATARHGG